MHPGPEISAPAAASLAGVGRQRAGVLLAELTGAHLLSETTPGRYALHDLLRAYATEQAQIHENRHERRNALRRTLDYYLHSAHRAELMVNPRRDAIDIMPVHADVIPECPEDTAAALAWFTAERAVLLAATELAAAEGLHTYAWQLAWTLRTYLIRRGHLREQLTVQRTALQAAERSGDAVGQGHALSHLGCALARLGQLDEASHAHRKALRVFTALGYTLGRAHALTNLATVADRQGRPEDALRYAEHSLDLYRAADHANWVAMALNNIGWSHAQLGDYRSAVTFCTQAVASHRDIADQEGEAGALDSLGYVYSKLAEHERAAACYQRALDLYRDLGDEYEQAGTLEKLGDAHQATGNPHAAAAAWQEALPLLHRLDHPHAERIRTKLSDLS